MKKESLLLIASTIGTLFIGLLLLRSYAPGLIGLPVDMRLVKTSEEVPPFFSGVFRRADYESPKLLVNDPVVVIRGRPRLPEGNRFGPHDILGFRNRHVPNVSSIVVIGDSQTYGNNVRLDENWPSVLRSALGPESVDVYAMAVGGWGAAQYVEMATTASTFLPAVVVIAFYTGNDPLESFAVAYGDDRWMDLRPDSSLKPSDAPSIPAPPKPEETWRISFGSDGSEMTFTPLLRLASNQDHPAVHAGYAVMANAAREISRLLKPFGVVIFYTIIPTKELVFADRLKREGIRYIDDYAALVDNEAEHIARLADQLRKIDSGVYVDVLGPLRRGVDQHSDLYPSASNGHPLAPGYRVIGTAIANAIRERFPDQFSRQGQ